MENGKVNGKVHFLSSESTKGNGRKRLGKRENKTLREFPIFFYGKKLEHSILKYITFTN